MGRMTSGRRLWSALIALRVLITAPGGTGTTTDDEAAATNSQPTTESSSPASTPSTATATPSPTADPPNPVSLQALMAKEYNGRQLRVGRVLASTSDYTRHFVTYKSGKLTISGIMNIPEGNGPRSEEHTSELKSLR